MDVIQHLAVNGKGEFLIIAQSGEERRFLMDGKSFLPSCRNSSKDRKVALLEIPLKSV